MRPYHGIDIDVFRDAGLPQGALDGLMEIDRALKEVSDELSANRTGVTGSSASQAVLTSGDFGTDNRILTSDGQVRNAQASSASISDSGGLTVPGDLDHDGSGAGFFGTAPASKPTVSGSKSGNVALSSLMTALAALGLVTDSTT